MSEPAHIDPAFERLVAEHRPGVLRLCRSILRDEHLGDDAAQEAFLRLWRRRREGRAPRSVGPWLERVAVTTALDQIRRRRLRADAEKELDEQAPAAAAEPAEARAYASLGQGVLNELESLPSVTGMLFYATRLPM